MKVGIEVSKGYLRLRFPRALFKFKNGQVQESTLARDYSLIEKRIRALPTTDANQAVMTYSLLTERK